MNYIDYRFDRLEEIFILANEDGLDMYNFIPKFLLSEVGTKLIKYGNINYYHPINLYNEYINKNTVRTTNNHIPNIIISYIAYLYSIYLNTTNESINMIIKYISIDDILTNYDSYHTIDESKVLTKLKIKYNLKRNINRKERSINNIDIKFDKESKYLYLAKHIYEKLLYTPNINPIYYNFKEYPYLRNEEYSFIYKSVTCIEEIHNILKDKQYERIRYDISNNILFIKIDKNFKIGEKDINKISLTNRNKFRVGFDKILLFDGYKIYYISYERGYEEFYITINKLDKSKVEKEYNNKATS